MSMDKSAIEQIQKSIAADKAIEKMVQTDVPIVVVPDNMQTISLEKYMAAPSRFRGEFKTPFIRDFANYVAEQNPCASCFINPEDMSAKAYMDLGTHVSPEHGEHTAYIDLKPTEPYRALKSVCNGRKNQREMLDFLEDWRHLVEPIKNIDDDGATESMTMTQAIAAIRKMSVKTESEATNEEQSFASRRSAMQNIDLNSNNDLPAAFDFTVTPFYGLASRAIRARLQVSFNGDSPSLTLRMVAGEQLQEDLADEFSETLKAALPETVNVVIGSFIKP